MVLVFKIKKKCIILVKILIFYSCILLLILTKICFFFLATWSFQCFLFMMWERAIAMNDRCQKFGLLCEGKREDNIATTLTAALVWFISFCTVFFKILKYFILFFLLKIIFLYFQIILMCWFKNNLTCLFFIILF